MSKATELWLQIEVHNGIFSEEMTMAEVECWVKTQIKLRNKYTREVGL